MLENAIQLYQDKKFKKCFLQLIQVSNKMSHDVNYLDLMYRVQLKLNDFISASKVLSILINKTTNENYAIDQMNLLMSMNRHNDALDIGLSLESSSLSVINQKQLFYNLIDIYIVFNDFEGLQEVLETYKISFSTDHMSYFANGLLNIHNDNLNEAILCLRKAVVVNPSFDRAWISLAMMHNQMGDTDLALANIEKALDMNDQNPVAIKCYALWKEQQGEYKLACNKISGYLQNNNFDHDMTLKEIELLKKTGHFDLAYAEEVKLRYYFGHI